MDKDNWEMRDTSPVESKRIQLCLPVSFNLGSSANTSSPLFFQSLSFSWMPPLQWEELGPHFKSRLTWLEMLENLAKTELCHLKTTFALHPFLLWSIALPSPPPSRAGWDAQAHACLHCCHLSELPGWVLSICRALPPSVQPAPAGMLQGSCENQDHGEFSTLLFPSMLFLLLKFCDPWQRQQSLLAAPTGFLWQLTTCFSLSLSAAWKKTSVFSIWGRWFLMTFNNFYLRSKSTPAATPPHFVRAVCTVSSADGNPAVPPFGVAPGTSHAWQTRGDTFLHNVIALVTTEEMHCTINHRFFLSPQVQQI